MDDAVRVLLTAADDPTHVEGDPGRDWSGLQARLIDLRPELERIAGRAVVLDDTPQDATFFADLSIQRPGPQPNWVDTVLALRFSNFGRLFTTWSHSAGEHLPDDVAAALVAAAERAGFVFVPPTALDCSYDGCHPAFAGSSWWIRFFDYV